MKEYNIVVASTNQGKIQEISDILKNDANFKIHVKSLKDYSPNINEPEEPHHHFLENAIHKAKFYARLVKEATLSDDSGLCIEALDGFPGVRTKEMVDACGGIGNAFLKLENLLAGKHNFNAYFCSATVLYIPKHDLVLSHEAKDYGRICFPPRGKEGFAFDPIFIPEGYDKTFAELGLQEKNKISHRAQAVKGLMKKLNHYMESIQ